MMDPLTRPMEPWPMLPEPEMVSWLVRILEGEEPVMMLLALSDMMREPPPERVTLGAPMVRVVANVVAFIEKVPAFDMGGLVMVRLPPASILTWPPVGLVRRPLMVLLPPREVTSKVPPELLSTGALMTVPPCNLMVPLPAWVTMPPLTVTLFSKMSVLALS